MSLLESMANDSAKDIGVLEMNAKYCYEGGIGNFPMLRHVDSNIKYCVTKNVRMMGDNAQLDLVCGVCNPPMGSYVTCVEVGDDYSVIELEKDVELWFEDENENKLDKLVAMYIRSCTGDEPTHAEVRYVIGAADIELGSDNDDVSSAICKYLKGCLDTIGVNARAERDMMLRIFLKPVAAEFVIKSLDNNVKSDLFKWEYKEGSDSITLMFKGRDINCVTGNIWMELLA